MTRKLTIAGLSAALCAAAALAQSSAQPHTATTTTGPSAWVYVSSTIGTSNQTEVHAFTAGSNGKLTSIPGSPYNVNLRSLAINGLYLFGTSETGTMIDAYKIESNGSIHYSASTNADRSQCNSGIGPIFLDHSGASLYNMYFDSTCSNYAIQAWSIVKSNGSLKYLDTAGSDDGLTSPLTFTPNNSYGYTGGCYRLGPEVYAFRRNSSGSLTQLAAQPLPQAPSGQDYCPNGALADPYNHVIVPVQPYSGYNGPLGPWQLAIYTAHTDGSLTTSSTYKNMLKLSGDLYAMRLSPSGKLLAVSTANGLKVYHFSGTQITGYTGYMSTIPFNQILWDKDNHLYALSYNSNRLSVFTVTPTSWKWDAAYTINQPLGMVVQPLPLPWQ